MIVAGWLNPVFIILCWAGVVIAAWQTPAASYFELMRSGKYVELTAKEFLLLELLLRRQGEVLSRTVIASQVWDMNFDSDTNVVEVAIKRLRSKIDSNFSPKLIQNIRGMGYVLEVEDDS